MRNGYFVAMIASCLVLPLYLVVMLPIGVAARYLIDPLRLRFRKERPTYFRLVRRPETLV
jgi:hypothetical protein